MNLANILWWLCYVVFAIVLQAYLSGLDFLLAGFIVAIQERVLKQFVVVFITFLFMQEGMGTMAFGGVFIWYLTAVFLYILGQWLFEVESFSFILLLSIALSVTHYFILLLIADLQDTYINKEILIDYSVYQAFLTPVFWIFAKYTRRGIRYAA